jgi:hypothetical protein
MTIPRPDPVDLDDAAIRLAMRLEQDVIGVDGAAVIGACCWLLAGMLRQAAHERGASVSTSLEYVVQQVWLCVGFLERHDTETRDVPRH